MKLCETETETIKKNSMDRPKRIKIERKRAMKKKMYEENDESPEKHKNQMLNERKPIVKLKSKMGVATDGAAVFELKVK